MSDMETQNEATPPEDSPALNLPKMWIGYVAAGIFLVAETIEAIIDPNSTETVTPITLLISLAGYFYWLYCVYKMHKQISNHVNDYPISPGKAVGFHFIPFFNLYWIFKWPSEIANLVNDRGPPKTMSRGWAGLFLLVGILVYRLIDGALGLTIIFSVGVYLNRKIGWVLGAQVSKFRIKPWIYFVAGPALVLILGLVTVGTLMETGLLPDSVILEGDKLSGRQLETLRSNGLLAPEEQIVLFYSDGLLSILEDGNFFTEDRVVSYQQTGDTLSVETARYDEIEAIEVDYGNGAFDYTRILVTTSDGWEFLLILPAEGEKDEEFVYQLKEAWQPGQGF